MFGGPLRSLLNLQEWLSDDYEFFILTRNHDLGSKVPYEDVTTNSWQPVEQSSAWYLSSPCWSPRPMIRAFNQAKPQLLYFHSAFDFCLTIIPLALRKAGLISRKLPVVVAPRGEFTPGARSIKKHKKNLFLLLAKACGLYRGVHWQATNDDEAAQIKALWGEHISVSVAPNLPPRVADSKPRRTSPKRAGKLRLVFLSRISRMKNLDGALEILKGVSDDVDFSIYGTKEDEQYWNECQCLIDELPANVRAEYLGPVTPEMVVATLSQYDILLLPTLGENFGHVVFESLTAGCPVLLSDRTPWRELSSSRAGYDIALEDLNSFRSAISRFAKMDEAEFSGWSSGAWARAAEYSKQPGLVEQTHKLLSDAISQ